MNIFELVLTDPASYNQISLDLAPQQHSWLLFKQNISTLFTLNTVDSDPFFSRSRELWTTVRRNTPELLPPMTQYYLNQLQQLITGPLDRSLQEVSSSLGNNKKYQEMEVAGLLASVREIYCAHEKYIQLFDKDARHISTLRNLIAHRLTKYALREKLTALLTEAFKKNSLNTLKSEVIEFDQPVREYISNRYQSSSNFVLQLFNLRGILDQLQDLHLLQANFEPITNFLNLQIQEFIVHNTDFSEGGQFLHRCLAYSNSFHKQFLKAVKSPKTEELLGHLMSQIDDNVFYLCAKHCSTHILDIILDFPDSLSTILSLKRCLEHAPLLGELGEHLSVEVGRRLLIPGVITQNILNQYINMLKVLQLLDPQGLVFEQVTLPIKNYLLRRNDTLRCIISHLTEDNENYSKLTREVVKIPSKEYIEQMSSEQDENAAKEWQLLPLRQNKTKMRVKYQQIDLVTVLVGLYGSQEAFISEYQNMMAEKLMGAKDYNIDEEIRNIELLKMRFGESALQVCNIIVKDVKDSRRNDTVIHQPSIALSELNCLSVSKGYWPINYENASTYQLPVDFRQIFEQYSARFAQIKAMRKISFHYNLGHVNLTLSFDNGNFPFKCLPIQAVLITYFDEDRIKDPRNGVSSEQLSSELQIPQNIVKQKMSFWVHKGVVKEHRQARTAVSLRRLNSFEDGEVVYYKPAAVYQNVVKQQMEDDVQSSLLKESTSMESHLRHIIEGLILSILNTNGPKSPEKIHLLLKTVYKTDLDYTYGEAQTAEILKKMVQKKKIHFNGETYSSREE